jgi:UDP-glucuronate 4-epimerase
MKILVTGAAGFIGMHTSQLLLARGDQVVGLDNLNDYYEVQLKHDRLARLTPHENFRFVKMDVADNAGMAKLFAEEKFDKVIHLAAQAGVRYSLVNPQAYVESNLVGFMNILEGCRHSKVQHLVYASSSSVYGGNTRMPFSEHDSVDHPVSMYAATKKANELMAHTYSHLFGLPTTGLRFFTVYGPWGRPDMALFLFTKAILEGKPIDVFNHGKMKRDFTYVDDIVQGVIKTLDHTAEPDAAYNAEAAQPQHQQRALPGVQHRQQQPGGADGLCRGHRERPGQAGREELPAPAGWRRAGHLRQHRRPQRLDRLCAGHPGAGGHRPLRRVVSRLLRQVSLGRVWLPVGAPPGRVGRPLSLKVQYRVG